MKNNPVNEESLFRTNRPKSVLEAFEHIVEMVENSNMSDKFMEAADAYIKYASRKLNLPAMPTILLAIFVDRSEDRRIMLSELARYVGCRTTKILRLSKEIDVLENLGYVVASRTDGAPTYRVPFEVLEDLRNNKPFVPKRFVVEDTFMFFEWFRKMMRRMDNGEISHAKLMEQTMEQLREVESTVFASKLASIIGDNDEFKLLFIFMARLFIHNNDDNIMFCDIEDLYDDDDIPGWIQRSLRSRSNVLFEKKLIENVNEDGLARGDAFKLTNFAKETILGELDVRLAAKGDKDLIKAETLAAKELIYNVDENAQIDELCSILSQERFAQIQTRLKDSGMRSGFCCLFYGAPGTGKTETVYQLARRTGRDILRVDVDKIKSCWVGESEKNIKALFDRYRNICANSDLAPILLFNEADAVLGVRMEGASRAVDKMENSIQNIILQEMETLEGIMIATTNLTTNLDKAFERRFLYKIRYEKPNETSRKQIWQIMLPGISDSDANTLAARFDLSGGEIENIARRQSVKAILSGDNSIDLAEIETFCSQERIASQRVRMGF